MGLEQTRDGLEGRLKVSGLGRFAGAGFLGFWLLGWAAGEGFALWFLFTAAWRFITGHSPERSPQFPSSGGTIAVSLFLLFWLTFWTFGGFAAMREFLRLLFGADRILVSSEGLQIEHSYGLFSSRRKVSRQDIRRIYEAAGSRGLRVDTATKPIELTRLGTVSERAELLVGLQNYFGMTTLPAEEAKLPAGWYEVSTPDYSTVLVKDPQARRKGAFVLGIIFAVVGGVGVYLFGLGARKVELLPLTIFVTAVAVATGWGALWLAFGRNEWKLESGKLTLRRRFRDRCKPVFEAVSLELVENNSDDGGPSFVLNGVAAGAPAEGTFQRVGKFRRAIYSRQGEPNEPRSLGLWLKHRCQLPFADLTSAESKAKALKEVIIQLESSGRFGRVVAKLLQRLKK